MAQLYRAFATYDKPVSIQFPSSPVLLGESLSASIPVTLSVQVNTSGIMDWSKVELFDYAQKIGEVLPGGLPSSTAIVLATLSAGDVHALTALVTRADGFTVRTTNIVTALTASFQGDFNNDGAVDAADYVVWRKGLGTMYTQSDYNAWRARFGQTAGSGLALGSFSNTTIPEPAAATLLILVAAGVALRVLTARSGRS
jgi:hypothetical protein